MKKIIPLLIILIILPIIFSFTAYSLTCSEYCSANNPSGYSNLGGYPFCTSLEGYFGMLVIGGSPDTYSCPGGDYSSYSFIWKSSSETSDCTATDNICICGYDDQCDFYKGCDSSSGQCKTCANPLTEYKTDYDNDKYSPLFPSTTNVCTEIPSGYTASNLLLGTNDCNDVNININPLANDICGNSIDEDCSGSDATNCANGASCSSNSGCSSGNCNPSTNKCETPVAAGTRTSSEICNSNPAPSGYTLYSSGCNIVGSASDGTTFCSNIGATTESYNRYKGIVDVVSEQATDCTSGINTICVYKSDCGEQQVCISGGTSCESRCKQTCSGLGYSYWLCQAGITPPSGYTWSGTGNCPSNDGCHCSYIGSPTACTSNCNLGDSCTTDSMCSSGSCYNNLCQTKVSDGNSCDSNPDCTTNNCDGTTMRCTTLCTPSTIICGDGIDQNCDSIDETNCANGVRCSTDASCTSGSCYLNLCQTRGSVGNSCDSNPDCTSNNCDGGICQSGTTPLKSNGQSCTADTECSSGRCSLGTCQAQLNNGNSCTRNTDCISNTCLANICVGNLVNGASCTLDYDCQSGRCD